MFSTKLVDKNDKKNPINANKIIVLILFNSKYKDLKIFTLIYKKFHYQRNFSFCSHLLDL